MPGETAIPFLISIYLCRNFSAGLNSFLSAFFIEHSDFDKFLNRLDSQIAIVPFRCYGEFCPGSGGKHRNLHNALGVSRGLFIADFYIRCEPACYIDEQHRRPHMQAIAIFYLDIDFTD
jgi:hypothetical protein